MNSLTIVDSMAGDSSVYGSMGPDNADSLERFGKGRMWYARQYGDLYKYNFILQKMLDMGQIDSLLYVGCSSDYVRRMLDQQGIKCSRYVGVDLHIGNLTTAVNHENSIAADYYCQDVSKGLKFKDDEFQVVLALDIVEHLPTKTDGFNLIDELIRVTSETLIVTTPQMQDGVLGFPDVHNFEFDCDELELIRRIMKSKFSTIDKWGIHLSEAEFDKLKTQYTYIEQMSKFLTPRILRGVFASLFTDRAKDVLIYATTR